MIVEIFALLIETTLATSLAAVLVLLMRRPWRRMVGARGAYALWLLLPIAGLGVILPARTVTLAIPGAGPVSIAPIRTVAATDIASPFDAQPLLLTLWSAGVIGLGLALACQQRRFRRALGQLRTRDDGSWQAEHVDAGPAVIGLWRGRIVLPSDFESRYTELERDLVLRHERVHLARRDPLANLAAAVLRCLYWFNPLLHYAVGRFRFDQELAADATVLAQRPEARRSYADAMLKTQLMLDPPPLGCHWQSAHPLKERIAMLKQPLPGAVRLAAGFVFALLLSAATGYAAWAAQPAQTVMADAGEDQGVAMVHLIRDGQRVRSARLSGTIGAQLGIDDGDVKMRFSFEELNPSDVLVSGEFTRGEEVLGRPILRIKRGSKGVVGIGKMRDDGMPELGAEFVIPGEIDASPITNGLDIAVAMGKPITLRGAGVDLRDAVTQVLASQGMTLTNPELLPAGGDRVEFNFNETPLMIVVTKLVEGTGLELVANAGGKVTLMKKDGFVAEGDSAQLATELWEERRMNPPRYPLSAIKGGAQGKVVLNVMVGRDGKALQVELDQKESTPNIDAKLVAAAREAAINWTFAPAKDDRGKAVEGWVSVPVTFSLSEDEAPSAQASPLPVPRLVAVDEAHSGLPTYRRISPPKYPKTAIEEKREGKVLLRVLVGADGAVQQVEIEATSGSSDLDEAAKASVRKWAFNAANDGYKDVATWVGIPIDFSLDDVPSPGADAPGALEEIYVRPASSTSQVAPQSGWNFGWTDQASGKLGWVESSDQC